MITVLMGAPAAGKTTWVKKNMAGNEHIYSTELVRIDRELDVDYYMASIRAAAIKACKSGQDVIADGTHTITHHRTFWLRLANRFDCNTKLIVFALYKFTTFSIIFPTLKTFDGRYSLAF